jgi:hypothetical protein
MREVILAVAAIMSLGLTAAMAQSFSHPSAPHSQATNQD